MIDDFCVPDDSGYEFDDYGEGKILNLSYLSRVIEAHNLSVYFPAKPSNFETGAKRGCVVLISKSLSARFKKSVTSLREYV